MSKTKSQKDSNELSNKTISKKLKSVIENSDDSENTKAFKRILNLYLENLTKFSENVTPELEVRFGTKKIKNITKIDFYNVVKSIMNFGFKLNNENYFLKIILDNEFSNIRTELKGLPNIAHYCKYNTIDDINDTENLNFVEKEYFKYKDEPIYPLDFDDFNFRLAFQVENNYNIDDEKIRTIINKWSSTKKIFRHIKRFEYIHPQFPFAIHLSIVKTSKVINGKMIPQFNIKDSDVFNSLEHYEIEIECNNNQLGIDSNFETGIFVYDLFKKTIKYVLIGLQQTNFPISLNEQYSVIDDYMKLIKGDEYDKQKKLSPKDFIGPSSNTLQMINLLNEEDINETNNAIPNIRKNYTVTDKADGSRKLLYINDKGKIFLITTNINIEFTGCYSENKEIFNTLIDGEHILTNKHGEFINLFACFDIYYINKQNVTMLPFINIENVLKEKEKSDKKEKDKKEKEKDKREKSDKQEQDYDDDDDDYKKEKKELKANNRLVLLNSVIKKMNIKSVLQGTLNHFKIVVKKFYANNVFDGCTNILNSVKKGLYEYNTDGIIFTPANTSVASNVVGKLAPNYRVTWMESFKWKPPEFNTIDFLIKFKKNEYGSNIISNMHNNGISMTSNSVVQNYFTLILHVGFDEKKHGYINPFNDIINDYINKDERSGKYGDYKPARFYPTNPSDNNAGICNIIGNLDNANNLKIYTLEGEEIEDNTIIEFSYDASKPEFWRWTPLRVRYDKTSELRSGEKNFGNAYHVANSNWQSIHKPVTENIIMSGKNIIIDNNDDDVYYNKVSNKTNTRALRDFHNLYVKNTLLNKIISPGNTLIDYACGKGGDLPKWINSKLSFILGLDLSKDNIENRMDGACARYLNYAKKFSVIPRALFLNGNSSKNIKSGDAFSNEKNKNIIKAVFGEGTKNAITLGKGVYNNYGIAKIGFNVSSIQFAFHYMFENRDILTEYLNNVAQCTAINGYFIGCCYNGKKIFNYLETLNNGQSKSLFNDENKIWEITKRYENNEFNNDESCLGYAIDVFQESINKTFREYLVNFDYLVRLMEDYGFVLLKESEYKQLNLPGSMGTFEELYKFMNEEIKKDKRLLMKIGTSLNMSDEEKKISFFNNYFIFKKIRNVDKKDKIKKLEDDLEIEEQDKKLKTEFKDLDEDLTLMKKKEIEEKSKKLAQKYLEEKDKDKEIEETSESENPIKMEDTQEPGKLLKDLVEKTKIKSKIEKKLTIDEKIALAEEKKKQREEEKIKLKQEKEKAKLEAKEKEKAEKKTLKEKAKSEKKNLQ
jgi:mRNA (guanine-N7-)-methyltransferase